MEQYANNAATTLAADYTAGGTALTVASTAGFPSSGSFRVAVDNEFLLVHVTDGTTLAIDSSGIEGSADTSHASGAAVTHVLTAGGLIQAIADRAVFAANNLSDLASASAARANLGLGTIAVSAADDYVLATAVGAAGGVAALDGTGKVPAAQLPADLVTSVAGRQGDVVLTYTDIGGLTTVAHTGAYGDLGGLPALGTAAALDVGTAASQVVQLDGSARLPAVDGSQLVNLPGGGPSSSGASPAVNAGPRGALAIIAGSDAVGLVQCLLAASIPQAMTWIFAGTPPGAGTYNILVGDQIAGPINYSDDPSSAITALSNWPSGATVTTSSTLDSGTLSFVLGNLPLGAPAPAFALDGSQLPGYVPNSPAMVVIYFGGGGPSGTYQINGVTYDAGFFPTAAALGLEGWTQGSGSDYAADHPFDPIGDGWGAAPYCAYLAPSIGAGSGVGYTSNPITSFNDSNLAGGGVAIGQANGTVTNIAAQDLVVTHVTFATAKTAAPYVLLSPVGALASSIEAYPVATAEGFAIAVRGDLLPLQLYGWNYLVLE